VTERRAIFVTCSRLGRFAVEPPAEVPPRPTPKKYGTRCGIAEWLMERLAEGVPILVGIDHGFSFPLARLAHLFRRFPAPLADG